MRAQSASRRRLFRTLLTVGAVAVRANADGQTARGVSGFDHVAVPMQNTGPDGNLLEFMTYEQ